MGCRARRAVGGVATDLAGAAGEYIGPFGKLRAGSSARKERGPQDDRVCFECSEFRFGRSG